MAEETKVDEQTEEKTLDLKRFLSSMRLNTEVSEPVPMLQDDLKEIQADVSEEDRFISGMAALLLNVEPVDGKFDKGGILEVIANIDDIVNNQINVGMDGIIAGR